MKKISFLLLALLTALALAGCQLAIEEESISADRFAGINVVLKTGWNPDEPSRSEPHEVDGYPFLIALRTDENGESYIASDIGECFSEAHVAIKTTDEGEEYSLTGVLYLEQSKIPTGATLMLESVYQREDGSLYAVSTGSNYGGHLTGLGYDRTDSHTFTDEKGEKRGETTTLHLDVREGAPIESAVLIAFSAENEVLSRQPLDDEDLTVSPDAAWALLVETLTDGSTRRTAFNAPFDDTSFEVHLPGENGMCGVRTYRIVH